MFVKIPVVRGFKPIERLFKIVSENGLGFLAGGYLRWACSPRQEPFPFRDIDVFTTGQESYEKLVQILSHQEKLPVKFETEMSITYQTKNSEVWKDCHQINLIKPQKENKLLTYGSNLHEILDNFDFSVTRVGIISETECLADHNFMYDEKNKKLRILKMESPIACIMRLCKYSGKGYRVSVPDVMEVLKEWDDRGIEYKGRLFKALRKVQLGSDSEYRASSLGAFSCKDLANEIDKLNPDPNDGGKFKEVEEDDLDLYHLIRIG